MNTSLRRKKHSIDKSKSIREAFGDMLVKLGQKDPKIVVVDADVSQSTKTSIFAEEFPERFFNVGISEQDMVSVGAGLASCGMKPFVVAFAGFLTGRAFDQIRNMVSFSKLNVKFVGTHAGLATGKDGATHQALEDISIMRSIPNMKVFSPADSLDVIGIMNHLITLDSPSYMRIPRSNSPLVHDESYIFHAETFDVLESSNEFSIVIFATGLMVNECLVAKKVLKIKGFNVDIINVHTIKPINRNHLLKILEHATLAFSVEDHNIIGGLGSSLAEIIAESDLNVKLVRFGVKESFGESGEISELYDKFGLSSFKLAISIEKYVQNKE